MTSMADTIQALNQQAAALFSQGRLDEAALMLTYSLQLSEENADAHVQLGNICVRRERFDEAISQYQQALRINPNLFAAHYILAIALHDKGRFGEAETHFRHAVRLNPDFAQAHLSLAVSLLAREHLDEAETSCREALRLKPDLADAYVNLGSVFQHRGKLTDAATAYQRALSLNPNLAEAWQNLGMVRKHQGNFDIAMTCIENSLRLKPDFPLAKWNRAVLLLLSGDLARGFPEYDIRWTLGNFGQRHFSVPLWDGSPLDGRTILLYAEQGLGDTIQFVRFVPHVRERGGRIILQCQPALLGLLKDSPGVDRVEVQGQPFTGYQVHAPVLSLPGIIGTTLTTVPANVPYLHADIRLVQHWRIQLQPAEGLKIGIAWQGNPSYLEDSRRSFRLTQFEALARIDGVRLISLQKGPGADQLDNLNGKFPVVNLSDKLDEASGPFMDTAAIMKCLDLVITSDTVIAHLAGALGITVWVALPFVPDWRWMLEREDSPWYPSMRLFRQRNPGDWDEVFERVGEALANVMEAKAANA